MDLMKLKAYLTLDSSEYESGISKAVSGAGKIAKIGAAAVTAAGAAVTAFGASAVSAGMDFDSAMSQVAATMGKSVDEIGDLRDFAQEMGSSTAFSATQAAEALNYMALAGYDADTSMKMLPNVLNLAAAGGMELATASDMVTDAQTALGLSLDETSTMVDQMAKTSTKTNTSVSQLGEAILTIGATARTVKGGTNELNTLLGVLADNSIKGAEGGTHLRNMIMSLQNPTDKGAAALESLGVAVYDDQGKMRSMIDIIEDLQTGMAGLSSDAERDSIINDLFNKTDAAAVNALLATTTDRFNELSNAIGNASGSAQKMADTQLDNLQGDITLFKSALEGFQIAVSDSLTPTLREFVTLGTEGLSEVASAFKEGGFEAAIETFGGWLSDALTMLIDYLPKIMDAGAKMLTALIKGLVSNMPKIIQAAKSVLTTIAKAIIQNLPTIVKAGVEAIAGLAKGIGEALPELIPAAVDAILTIVEGLIDNIDMLIDAALAIIVGLAQGLIQSIPRLIEAIPKIISSFVSGLIRSTPQIAKAGVDLFVSLVKNLPQIIAGIIKAVPSIIVELVKAILTGIPDMVQAGANLISGLAKGIIDGIGSLWGKVKGAFSGFVDGVLDFFGINSPSKMFADIGKHIDEGLAAGITKNTDVAERAMDGLNRSIEGGINQSVYSDDATAVLSGAGIAAGSANSALNRPLNVTLVLDREVLGKAVYRLNNEETQRVGVKLAGGVA